ncbi:rhomboid family intramembrane serine protease [Butyrivibrio sp. CB08]|uniref:rhomboid family intramembrane serine protease n=1 Tax=Butyrivibrio sp. CB08 TaxID=2364879 RepID=UPI000EA9CEB7|nr:rhomboid family intramembrane serine protease [Butyrivibrio sp. CB08]RKM55079.1 rhomboid family intramembrane serine protease [Butyrivibrio sp. CB08]
MQDNSAVEAGYWENQERIYKRSYVSIALLAANVIIFLLSSTAMLWLYEKGAMITEIVLRDGQYYRLFSAMFLHADVQHLFNNMMILALVGAIVENYTGHAFFAFLYFISGLFGNMISMAYEINHGLSWVSVGASGAIMGLVGFVVVWIIINRKTFIRSRGVLIRLGFLAAFVIYACFFQAGANTAAHLGGFVTGFVLGIINIVLLKNEKNMEGLA